MTKVESKIIDFIKQYVLVFFLIVITVCGAVLRLFGLEYQSGDYHSFLLPWWNQIQQGGIQGLAHQVGNYNIPYQIITYFFTLLPFGPLKSYKLLSIIFDFVLALSSGLFVYSWSKNNRKFKGALTYAIVLCSATVIFNSSFWAQCDSIYVSFILLSLYFFKKDKNILSFVFLGIAFAFKLQTVFILPVFVYCYFSTKKISILHFLIIPAVDFLMCLPALIFGRSITDIVTIYAEQTDYGKLIQFNCPNFYALLCDGSNTIYYSMFKTFSIVLTIVLLGTGLVMLLYKNVDLHNTENLLFSAIWSVFTCIMFLSSMHERYSYLLDVLLIIYAIITYKKIWLPIICSFISLRGYCYYLFKYDMLDIKYTALIYMAVYIYVSYLFFKDIIRGGKKLDAVKKLKVPLSKAL